MKRHTRIAALLLVLLCGMLFAAPASGAPIVTQPAGAGGGGAGIINWTGGSAITSGSAAAGGGTVDVNEASFFDNGAVYLITVTANGNTVNSAIREHSPRL